MTTTLALAASLNKSFTCESGHRLYPTTAWPQRYQTAIGVVIICNLCISTEIGRSGALSHKTISAGGFYHCHECLHDICLPCAANQNDFNSPEQPVDGTNSSKPLLVIHPDDRSTDFLRVLYEHIPGHHKTVITSGIDSNELDALIASHDRILMCGHGYKSGLLAMNQFKTDEMYIINQRHIPLLQKSRKNVFIWCFASDFVKQFNLKGFTTGMFISEVPEAVFCGLNPIPTQGDVDLSNQTFCKILGRYLLLDISSDELYRLVCQDYSVLAEKNQVAAYNLSLLRNF